MLLLALDTSSKEGSVAVYDDKALLGSRKVSENGKSASQLTPAIMSVIGSLGIKIDQVGCVAVTTGPGSFTGLRVGVTTAKVLSYALNCDVIGVNTLTALTAKAFETVSECDETLKQTALEKSADGTSTGSVQHSEMVAVVDAQRQQLFVLRCQVGTAWSPDPVGEVEIIERDELAGFARDAGVLGPGLERLSESQLAGVHTLDRSLWSCSGETVGRHAIALLAGGEKADFWSLKPNYFRASSAEEKKRLMEKSKGDS